MPGSGVVSGIANTSSRDGTAVWRLYVADGPGNADVRAWLQTNRQVATDIPAHVAVDIVQVEAPRAAACPIAVGAEVSWGARHVTCGDRQYRKVGFEYDPDDPTLYTG